MDYFWCADMDAVCECGQRRCVGLETEEFSNIIEVLIVKPPPAGVEGGFVQEVVVELVVESKEAGVFGEVTKFGDW